MTSGRLETAAPNLAALAARRRNGRWSHRDQMKNAKPDPDPLVAKSELFGAPIKTAAVVGDSIWDMPAARRWRAVGVALLSGGYGDDQLVSGGASRA